MVAYRLTLLGDTQHITSRDMPTRRKFVDSPFVADYGYRVSELLQPEVLTNSRTVL